jgi:hypothetical protein
MPRNDEGDFELVLGNRQLLSGFFIVVTLFAIFFSMGYVVGRHSSPAPMNTAAAAGQESVPLRPASPSGPPPGQAEVVAVNEKPREPAASETSPQPVGTRPATAPPETPRSIEKAPAEPRGVSSGASEPAPGSYLQVAAPKRTAADGVVESLKNKGIVAVLAPGPNEDTVRVLVGPLDSSTIGKMRVDLESAGFKPFPKKY